MLVGCGNDPTELSRVRSAGEIRIAVRSVPDRALGTPVHLARDLTSRFAKWLGVRATYVENSHPKQARQARMVTLRKQLLRVWKRDPVNRPSRASSSTEVIVIPDDEEVKEEVREKHRA